MGFAPGYGIHGTNKGWDIQYPVSGGCIRMQDADAQELYDIVEIGTPVNITYETMFLTEKYDGIYITLLPDIYQRQTNHPDRIQQLFAPYSNTYIRLALSIPDTIEYHTIFAAKLAIKPRNLSNGAVPATLPPTLLSPVIYRISPTIVNS